MAMELDVEKENRTRRPTSRRMTNRRTTKRGMLRAVVSSTATLGTLLADVDCQDLKATS